MDANTAKSALIVIGVLMFVVCIWIVIELNIDEPKVDEPKVDEMNLELLSDDTTAAKTQIQSVIIELLQQRIDNLNLRLKILEERQDKILELNDAKHNQHIELYHK